MDLPYHDQHSPFGMNTNLDSSMTPSPAESVGNCLSEICSVSDETYYWESPRRFSGYAKRLELVLNQFLRSSPENFTQAVHTALKGLAGDLTKSRETLSVYRNKSKIYVLINCRTLCESLQGRTVAIGGWLALLDSALVDTPDLHKKMVDLSREMKQAQFKVTESEERVYCTLQKEASGRQASKAVQSAIIMDLARALGTDLDNHLELEKQIKLLKKDVALVSERRILLSLERIFDTWSVEPNMVDAHFEIEFEEEAQILPFKNFICPLTKEVMKDPVVLESSQSYERTSIQYWFQRCIEDGRDPICPVTGQVLNSLELKPNIGLSGTIDEWVNRNVDIKIKLAVEHLTQDSPPVDSIQRVFDTVYKLSEEHPLSRYRIRNAGLVLLILKMLKNRSKSIGSHSRSKALAALFSMAKDEESKQTMLKEGMTRLAIHSLIGSLEKEREYAVKVLLEFSSDEAYCASIASEKGALVLLSSMVGNLEHPSLSNLAEEVLKRIEKVDENVQHLAAAGRFEPLLNRLCQGTDDVRIKMASMVGNMTLTNSSKEQIARQAAKILVDMLSNSEGRMESLQALHNLSSLDDNAIVLVDSGLLKALTDILFRNKDGPQDLKELAASTIANIVSNPGHWELASVSKEGFSMQSEAVVSSLLDLLPCSSPKAQVTLLQILCGIASSPQALDSVATHINSAGGIEIIICFLGNPEPELRIYAFKLTRILSEKLGDVLANELRASDNFCILKDKLLDTQYADGERSEAACILANLPLTDNEVKTVLGISLVRWTVTALNERRWHRSSSARTSRSTSFVVEGLLGLLLHFVKCRDPVVMDIVQEHRLMDVFREQLGYSLQPRMKQRAALGLKYLSESGKALVSCTESEPQRPGFFSSLMFMCGKVPKAPSTCPIHGDVCQETSQFCLLKSNCVKPLVELLNDEDTNVQITAVEALSTLLSDNSYNLKRAVDELNQLGVVDVVIALFTEVRRGDLQERAICMVEKILRVDTQQYSVNQTLVRALVDAFKHGTPNAKRHAQDALTSLKQLSGVSGKTSSQTRARRLGN